MTTPTNPLHAKLHQKVLDLHTGKAFADPKLLSSKMKKKWLTFENNTRQKWMSLLEVLDYFVFFSPILTFFYAITADSYAGIFFLILHLFAAAFSILALVNLTEFLGDDRERQEKTSNLLIRVLQKDLSYDHLIRDLHAHLDHPEILRQWWSDIDDILLEILNEQPETGESAQNKLTQLLAGGDIVDVEQGAELDTTPNRTYSHLHI